MRAFLFYSVVSVIPPLAFAPRGFHTGKATSDFLTLTSKFDVQAPNISQYPMESVIKGPVRSGRHVKMLTRRHLCENHVYLTHARAVCAQTRWCLRGYRSRSGTCGANSTGRGATASPSRTAARTSRARSPSCSSASQAGLFGEGGEKGWGLGGGAEKAQVQ